MLKISVVITDLTGKKYPVVLLFNSHNGLFVTTVIGEEATALKTLVDKVIENHYVSIQDFLGTLGTTSDFKIMENDPSIKDFIDRLRNN